jgi:hypothetical protein
MYPPNDLSLDAVDESRAEGYRASADGDAAD